MTRFLRRKITILAAILTIAILVLVVVLQGTAFGVGTAAHSRGELYSPASAQHFYGGYGTAESPFLISTPEHLNNIREYLGEDNAGKHFRLTQDIDLTEFLGEGNVGYDNGQGWKPIGIVENRFSGSLDGGGYTISGLWLDRSDCRYAGLFGVVQNARIENLSLVLGCRGISGGELTGGLAAAAIGYGANSVIRRVSVSGNIQAAAKDRGIHHIGGLVGNLMDYTVIEAQFVGTVNFISGSEIVGTMGGITGRAVALSMRDIFVDATLTGATKIHKGGIGGTPFMGGTLDSSFVKVGYNSTNARPFFANKVPHVGGNTPSVTNSFYFAEDSALAYPEYRHPHIIDNASRRLTADEINSTKAFAGFNFDTIWGFCNDGNIVLRAFGEAYDPPPPCEICGEMYCELNHTQCPICNEWDCEIRHPPNLTWLWILLGVLAALALGAGIGFAIYRRKKTETVEVEKEVLVEKIVEVNTLKKPLPDNLSKQERNVAELILQGKTRREIMTIMNLSDSAVGTYTTRIYVKTGKRW